MTKLLNKNFLKKLFLLKVKFASSSAIATAVDYCTYMVLVTYEVFTPVESHYISASIGMLINFFLQKKYIFVLERKVTHAFVMSVVVSIVGILLGGFFIHLLNKISFMAENQYITKLIVTGTIFFYNFYLKRYSFEKKFI